MRAQEAYTRLAEFQPRLPLEQVELWAERYSYRADDQYVIDAIAPVVQARGYFLREEFMDTYRWKTTRTAARAASYNDQEIADVTRVAFRQQDEKLCISLLRALDGVDWPVASVLLHVGLSSEYPIIDYRALWSLGSGQPDNYTFRFWSLYVETCRRYAHRAGVTVRELDKALWAYSEANQPRGTRS